MIMFPNRTRFTATGARLLPIALLVPFLALAQAPATTEPAPAPAAEAKDVPKDAAPTPPASVAPSDAPKEPAQRAPKGGAKGEESARSAAPPGVGDAPAPTGPLAPLAWLTGCWWGDVNKHEFREYWHPLRGDMMVGVSRMSLPDKVVSYEYLRLESRPDGVYYVAVPRGKPETAFKLAVTKKDGTDEIFTFGVPGTGFPTSLTYRRAGGGWLYVEVAGVVQGKEQKVTYPFRRVSCETGEFIRK
jgi:Domain of unknown function (DUF6265)